MAKVLVALGSNLPSADFGSPLETCQAAVQSVVDSGEKLLVTSRWYRTRPVPISDQPWFVNGIIQIETRRTPQELLGLLHRIEADFGRVRGERNAARVIDLDIIDFAGRISGTESLPPILPHPRLGDRAFVLLPLRDVAPDWRHPATDQTIGQLIDALPPDQGIEPLPGRIPSG